MIRRLIAIMMFFALSASASAAELTLPPETPVPAAETTLSPETPAPAAETTLPPETPAPTATPWPAQAAPVTDSALEDDGLLRVRLLSLGARDKLTLSFAGRYSVEGNGGFRFEPGASVVLFALDDEVWLEAGGMMLSLGASVTLVRHEADGLYIQESEKNTLYNGDLSVTAEKGALSATLIIGIEEYLYGVVAYEMSDSFPVEALKAQAVAARTYAMQRKYGAGDRGYDVVDTTSDQVFKGYDPEYLNVIAAVDATRGVVGTYNGAFAGCYYTASNGGRIAGPGEVWGGSGDYGYIIPHDDPYDLENSRSLVNSVSFSRGLSDCAPLREMVLAALPEEYELIEVVSATPEAPQTEGSRMYTTLRLDVRVLAPVVTPTPGPDVTPTPAPAGFFLDFLFAPAATPEPTEERVEEVRLSVYGQVKDSLNIGLNGGDYELLTVTETETGFTLEMRRFGHGVGMSQRGAQQMAEAYGFGWQEILNYYYPGMALERVLWRTPETEPLESLPVTPAMLRPEPTPLPTPAPLPEPEEGERLGTVILEDAGSMLNVRQQASLGAMVLARLESGRRVLVRGEPDENGWLPVRTAEFEGFVQSSYVKID